MSELAQAIGRVRRAMPRNADVMLICDEIEKLMARKSKTAKPKLSRAEIQRNYRQRKKREQGKQD